MDALVKNATQRTPIGLAPMLVIEPGQTATVPNWEVLREKPATAARLECGDLVEVDGPAIDDEAEEAERQRAEAEEAERQRQRLEDEERQRAEAEEAERQRLAAAEAAAAANKQKPHVPTPRR